MSLPSAPSPQLVMHRLLKDVHGSSQLELRPACLAPAPAALRLLEELVNLYNERLGKGFGRFEEDEDSFPMPRLLRDWLEGATDFHQLSVRMMQHLQTRCDQEELATGGHVLIARSQAGQHDHLYVAILGEITGSQVTDALDIADCVYLDTANLRMAGRIDLQAWRRGAERYISFLRGRANVAQYFKQFLGCNDLLIAVRETRKLVQGLEKFAGEQQLDNAARDELYQRAHTCLDQASTDGAELSIDDLVHSVWPQASEQLRHSLADETLQLADGFVPDRRALRPLLRFKAASAGWKLEFDRSSLHSGSVIYDRQHDRLILTEIPETLRRELLGERD